MKYNVIMNNRFLILAILLLFVCGIQTHAGNADTFNVKKYGAIGNGTTDDYNAIMKAVAALNAKGSGVLYFPKGSYYIAEYITATTNPSDVIIKNCNNLVVTGYGAKIIVNGNFSRKIDYISGKKKLKYSKTRSLIPIAIVSCKQVTIEGLELAGQVNKMKNPQGLMEAPARLLNISGSKDVLIKDIYTHHSMTDGIYIGHNNDNTSENVRGENIISSNNGRQGMSIVGLYGGTFNNCVFKNTGITEGSFNGFAPRAGVDIEPEYNNKISNITFNKCTFQNNVGGQLICSTPNNTQNVTLNNCIVRAGASKTPYQIVLSVKNAVVENSDIDCGVGSVYPIWNSMKGSSATLRNNQIKSQASGIAAIPNKELNEQVLIENNTITYTGNSVVKKFFPYITSKGTRFINNTVIIPSRYQKPKGNTLIRNAVNSNNNFKDEKGMPMKKAVL